MVTIAGVDKSLRGDTVNCEKLRISESMRQGVLEKLSKYQVKEPDLVVVLLFPAIQVEK